MTDTRQRSCEERIDESLERRIQFMEGVMLAAQEPVTEDDLEELDYEEILDMAEERHTELPWTKDEGGHYREARDRASLVEALVEQSERADDEWFEAPLGVSASVVVTVQFSWGGPSDEFRVYLDEEGLVSSIDYHFMDWFDGAKRTLHGKEEKIAEEFLSRFTEHALMALRERT